MSTQLSLEYQLNYRGARELELTYSVMNNGDAEAYLFTPLTAYKEKEQDWVAAPKRIYTYVDEEGVLHLTKQLWPVPLDVDVYMPEVPFLTHLAARKKFSETVILHLPVQTDLPYEDDDDDQDAPAAAKKPVQNLSQVVFSIGYVIPKDSPTPLDIKPHSGGKFYTISYGAANLNQKILRGQPVNLQVSFQK
jgi:hypothetical protein